MKIYNDKNILTRVFSRYACKYDEYANVQSRVASELIKLLPSMEVRNILEPGCGTGIYTSLLRDKFSRANIFASDISESMIEKAGKKSGLCGVDFTCVDCEDMELSDGLYDLITSNACFHWLKDFEGALGKFKRALTEDGRIIFSIFGPRTFWELDMLLKSVLGDNNCVKNSVRFQGGSGITLKRTAQDGLNIDTRQSLPLIVNPARALKGAPRQDPEIEQSSLWDRDNVIVTAGSFIDRDTVEKLLWRYFNDVIVIEKNITVEYLNLKDLLLNIKYTGTRGGRDGNLVTWNRDLMQRVESAYLEKFGRIIASYQVFFCRAVK